MKNGVTAEGAIAEARRESIKAGLVSAGVVGLTAILAMQVASWTALPAATSADTSPECTGVAD